MAVGQCSDLRRMSDAEDLMALGALTQYLADTAGCFARYTAVDLVVNNGRHGVFISHCVFNGKGNTAQLTARGDLCQRLRSFAGVCGDIELDAVLPMAGQRAARMAKRHPHARHVQEVQRARDTLVQLIKSFQTGLGQSFGLFPREGVKAALLFLQVLYPLLRGLYHLKFFPRPLPESEDVLYGVSVLPPELIDKVDALLDLVQLCVVGVVGIQTANEVCGDILRGVIKVEQLARTGRQLSVELCRCVHSVGGFAQKVNSSRGLVAAGEQRVTLCDTVPDG